MIKIFQCRSEVAPRGLTHSAIRHEVFVEAFSVIEMRALVELDKVAVGSPVHCRLDFVIVIVRGDIDREAVAPRQEDIHPVGEFVSAGSGLVFCCRAPQFLQVSLAGPLQENEESVSSIVTSPRYIKFRVRHIVS